MLVCELSLDGIVMCIMMPSLFLVLSPKMSLQARGGPKTLVGKIDIRTE